MEINKPPYGCKHYLRRCEIIAPCCQKIFPCRLCHDELTTHKIDRYKIEQVKCTNCNTIQNTKQQCSTCQTIFGLYYCNICHLFDDIDKGQYHCFECGFCRIGKEQFQHCKLCNMCINKDNIEHHKCIELKDSNCPICMSDLYKSTNLINQMSCGHYIHINCLIELLKSTYKCPICNKSIIKTDILNKYLDNEIDLTPMPDDYKNIKLKILCNDCHTETETPFHIIGLKCQTCNSYNTRKL
jgi:RING finger and CHY zinc finger domain-containing protein 1